MEIDAHQSHAHNDRRIGPGTVVCAEINTTPKMEKEEAANRRDNSDANGILAANLYNVYMMCV